MRYDPERLLAAVLASMDSKIDYARIAEMYGEGATPSAVEHRMRPLRRTANEMRNDARDDAATADPGTPRARTNRITGTPRSSGTRKGTQVETTPTPGGQQAPANSPATPGSAKRRQGQGMKRGAFDEDVEVSPKHQMTTFSGLYDDEPRWPSDQNPYASWAAQQRRTEGHPSDAWVLPDDTYNDQA